MNTPKFLSHPRKILLVFLAIQIFLLAAFFWLALPPQALELPEYKPTLSASFNYAPESRDQNPISLGEARKSYGSGYFVSPDEQLTLPVSEAFRSLPPIPNDFEKIIPQQHQFPDERYLNLSESYFLQPEFLPAFETQGLPYYHNPQPQHFYRYGLGVLPFEQTISLRRDETSRVTMFWHTAFGVQSYQGLRIQFFYPEQSLALSGEPYHTQDSETINRYFDVTLDSQEFLLGPSYPFFDSNWNHKVIVTIRAHPDAPPGKYVIGFNPVIPESLQAAIWKQDYPTYVSAAEFTILGYPRARINLTVQP